VVAGGDADSVDVIVFDQLAQVFRAPGTFVFGFVLGDPLRVGITQAHHPNAVDFVEPAGGTGAATTEADEAHVDRVVGADHA